MQHIFYALPVGVCERMARVWHNRPPLPPGMTYNWSRTTGAVVVGIPAHLEATVVGTTAFGRQGSDIDIGVQGLEVEELPEGVRTMTITYPKRELVVTSERLILGEFEFVALPDWRLRHDAGQYARAAAQIHATIGLGLWLAWKRRDKIAAYQWAGITCKMPDGTFDM